MTRPPACAPTAVQKDHTPAAHPQQQSLKNTKQKPQRLLDDAVQVLHRARQALERRLEGAGQLGDLGLQFGAQGGELALDRLARRALGVGAPPHLGLFLFVFDDVCGVSGSRCVAARAHTPRSTRTKHTKTHVDGLLEPRDALRQRLELGRLAQAARLLLLLQVGVERGEALGDVLELGRRAFF